MSQLPPGGWCKRIMIRVGKWSGATQFDGLGLDRNYCGGTSLPQQRAAVEDDPIATNADVSLAGLVRQWVTASEAVERQARPEGDETPLRPSWTPPREDLPDTQVDLAPVLKHVPRLKPVDAPAPVAGVAEASDVELHPALPRRRRQPQPRPACRLAVLIDAETTAAESADALFELLADLGTVNVCRAYADWTSPEAQGWGSSTLRQHGIQPYHHVGHGHRGLVALTIDAVDLARDSAVDAVAIVGDLVSVHPLVERLNASGVQVLGFGTTWAPEDVRALCEEFVDLSSLGYLETPGRHRAQPVPAP
jgi:hypothetical protein